MGNERLSHAFARDMVVLKQVGINPVIVHGGGPQIGDMLNRLSIESDFVDGLRVTDAATVEVVEMVLTGKINKQIVSAISGQGGKAVGLSGKDGNIIVARKLHRMQKDPDSNIERILDLPDLSLLDLQSGPPPLVGNHVSNPGHSHCPHLCAPVFAADQPGPGQQ